MELANDSAAAVAVSAEVVARSRRSMSACWALKLRTAVSRAFECSLRRSRAVVEVVVAVTSCWELAQAPGEGAR